MVQFAGKKWIVADIDGEGVTLLYCDTQLPKTARDSRVSTTSDLQGEWATCDLRNYLNSNTGGSDPTTYTGFMAGGFAKEYLATMTEQEFNAIVPVTNKGERYLPFTEPKDTKNFSRFSDSVDRIWLFSSYQVLSLGKTSANPDLIRNRKFKLFEDYENDLSKIRDILFPGISTTDGALEIWTRSVGPTYVKNDIDIVAPIRPGETYVSNLVANSVGEWAGSQGPGGQFYYSPCIKIKSGYQEIEIIS